MIKIINSMVDVLILFYFVFRPPTFPPFREGALLLFLPRPDPFCFPPPVDLLTFAHARLLDWPGLTPRFS
jgi:hypothetical protein